MRLELLTIGDELLLGETVDTNSAHIARVLGELGVVVVRRATVGDEPAHIVDAMRDALARTGALITTGGLGPTADDRTHESVAELLGVPLELHATGLAALEERWQQRFGRPMPASNRRQLMLPQGAHILENRHGSAPGVWCETAEGAWLATLPGVPREMRGMLADMIVPRLRTRIDAAAASEGTAPRVVRSRTLRTVGIAESALADRLGDIRRDVHGLPLAFLPGLEGVDLRVTSTQLDAAAAETALSRALHALRERVGGFAYGENDDDLAALVIASLAARDWTIAVAESCTGGLLGGRLTSVPGASRVVRGGVIAYDNAIKTALLDVPAADIDAHGAVSEPVARAMAAGARRRLGADVGVGITGVAGPGGGSPEKPVGTVWIAVETPDRTDVVKPVLPGDRADIRARAVQVALDRVRRTMSAHPPEDG